MSDDPKKDILQAVKNAQNSSQPSADNAGKFPPPKYLKHSLDEDGISFPEPAFRQDGKENK